MQSIYAFSLIAGFLFSLLLFLSGGHIRLFHLRMRIPHLKWMRRITHKRDGAAATPLLSGMFLTIFGLSGLLTHSWLIAFVVGGSAAMTAAFAAARFFADTASQIEGNLLYGRTGHVSLAIPEGGIGRIAYVADGKRVTLPARAAHAIERGKRIYIRSVEGKIAVVDEF